MVKHWTTKHIHIIRTYAQEVASTRDLLPILGINLKLCNHVIKEGDGPFKESTARMVDLGTYWFNDLNTENIKTE